MLVKSNLGEDIRRFQINENNLDFQSLKDYLAAIHHIEPDRFQVNIYSQGHRLLITTEAQFQRALRSTANHILRVSIEQLERPVKEASHVAVRIDMDSLFADAEFRRKLDEFITENYGLHPVSKEEQQPISQSLPFPEEDLVEEEPQVVAEEVVVEEEPEVAPEHIEESRGLSIVASFFARLKSTIQRARQPPSEEFEKPIPNEESLLERLSDMGFNDKEANIKVLRFHYNFQEGFDEVVEDLLTQVSEPDAVAPLDQESVPVVNGGSEVPKDEQSLSNESIEEKAEEVVPLEEDVIEMADKGREDEWNEEVDPEEKGESDSDEYYSSTSEDTEDESTSEIPQDGFPEGLTASDVIERLKEAGFTRKEAKHALRNF